MSEPKNFHAVTFQFFRSGLLDASNIDVIKTYQIENIVSLKTNPVEVEFEKKWAKQNGVAFYHIPMLLVPEFDKAHLWEAFSRIVSKLNLGKVLVHCTHGKDRTGLVVAMFRIMVSGWKHEEAIQEMDSFGFNPVFDYWKPFLRHIES